MIEFPWMEAEVPSHVHVDLVRNGVIPDPHVQMFDLGCQWVDHSDWTYECTFGWDGSEPHAALEFDCIDGPASLFLNDSPIGQTENSFIPYRFAVDDLLTIGENRLRVEFHSAVRIGDERRIEWLQKHGLPNNIDFFDERAFIRKPGYMFGWDWGPRLVSCGIAGEVRLVCFDKGIDDFAVDVSPLGDGWFRVAASSSMPGVEFRIEMSGEAQVRDPGPGVWEVHGALWNPRGHGEPVLHQITAILGPDQMVKLFGLRTVELQREADEHGESFRFVVNGNPIFCMGANWIPCHSFFSQCENVVQQIESYAALNFNMLRVWGGGLYESEDFYDACDRLGIMVWQDFPFACSYYPDDTEWLEICSTEARIQLKRLQHRASLVLWCGNNENLMLFQGGWKKDGIVPERFIGAEIFERVLHDAVKDICPHTPFIESSPIGVPAAPGSTVYHDGAGDSHFWEVWHGKGDWVHYSDSTARFCSEFGFASSPSLAVWQHVLGDTAEAHHYDIKVRHHDRTGKPWSAYEGYAELHYPKSETLEDWVYYSQLNQRDALRHAIEHFRLSSFCEGTLIWQANDCWPAESWAVEDSLGFVKPAGFELRRVYSPVVLLKSETGLVVLNDSQKSVDDLLKIRIFDAGTGSLLREDFVPVHLSPKSKAELVNFKAVEAGPGKIVHASLEDKPECERWILFDEPKNLSGSVPQITAEWADGVLTIHVVGAAVDLTAWDPADFSRIRDPKTGLRGWSPQTVINGSIHFRCEAPRTIIVRTLNSRQEIAAALP